MKPIEQPAGHHRHTPEELHNAGVAHEHSDINIRAIVLFLVGLAVVAIVVHVLMLALFVLLENRAAANDPPVSPVSAPTARMPPRTTGSPAFGTAPQPNLLTNEPAALRQFRQQEDQRLGTYGWSDEKAGVARLPISEAKKLIVERGLPARGDDTDPRLGTRLPAYGEASSGRVITGRAPGAGIPQVGAAPAPPQQHGAPPSPQKGTGHRP